MIKNLLFTSFLSFSCSVASLNKAPFHEPQKQNDTFSTFENESYFNDAFGDLTGYELSDLERDGIEIYVSYYKDENYIYYAFPIYYDFQIIVGFATLYYSNDYFNFYINDNGDGIEYDFDIKFNNYTGSEELLYFGRLNSSAMSEYIYNEQSEHLTGGFISSITQWVTGFMSVIVSGLSAFVAVFYSGEKLTAIGTLALMGVGIGLVTLAIAFVTRLFKR